MTEELAVEVIRALADLNINAVASIEAQEAGPPDWGVLCPPQPLDVTDIVHSMAKLRVRVKIHDGSIVFFPPPDDLPENAEEVEDVWPDQTACMTRFGHACSYIPCRACGNGAEDWLDSSSIQFGVTEVSDVARARMGRV